MEMERPSNSGSRSCAGPCFGVFAHGHRADKAAKHEPAEAPRVERQSLQSKRGYGHDRSDGKALKCYYDNGENEPEA